MSSPHRAALRSTRSWAGEPWTPQAVLGWAGLTLAATTVLIVCWYSASGAYTFDGQKTALNLAIVTVVMANLSGAALLVAGRRKVGTRRAQLLSDVPAALSRRRIDPGLEAEARAWALLVGGAGLTHYHRANCQMATGRDWPDASRAIHEQDGRKPCGVCRP